MIRNLKALGLALVAMFAMSAMASSTASAQTTDLLTSGINKTFLTGTSHDNAFKITSPATEFKCTTAKFSGEIDKATVSEATVKASYNGTTNIVPHTTHCSSSVGQVTVDMNSCDYLLTGKTDGKHNNVSNTHAQVHIVCGTAGDHIVITSGLCTVRVPAHTPTEGGVTFTTEGTPSTVKMNITVTGVTYTAHGGFCGLGGISTHGNNADYSGTVVVKGYSDAAHTTQVGIATSS